MIEMNNKIIVDNFLILNYLYLNLFIKLKLNKIVKNKFDCLFDLKIYF